MARSIQVDNLRPYTRYRLRIIAENIVGRSNASLPTRSFQTQQAAPGVPPGSVTVRALNATALRVSWTVSLPLSLMALPFMCINIYHSPERTLFFSAEKYTPLVKDLLMNTHNICFWGTVRILDMTKKLLTGMLNSSQT